MHVSNCWQRVASIGSGVRGTEGTIVSYLVKFHIGITAHTLLLAVGIGVKDVYQSCGRIISMRQHRKGKITGSTSLA